MSLTGSYAWEKLFIAVSTLAAGNFDLRERLANAWHHSLMNAHAEMHWPSLETFQTYSELRRDIEALGPLPQSLASMRDEDVSEFAKRIVSLFNTVARETG